MGRKRGRLRRALPQKPSALADGVVTSTYRDGWDAGRWSKAIALARAKERAGAPCVFRKRLGAWRLGPEPRGDPSRTKYWVNPEADGCFRCVCSTWKRGGLCWQVALVPIKIGARLMIWTDNPACTGGHDERVEGNTDEGPDDDGVT